MKNYFFSGQINSGSVTKLIEWIGENKSGTIYFCSEGGTDQGAIPLIHALNQRSRDFKLVGHDEIASNGFVVFFSFQGHKEILAGTTGHMHLGFRSVLMNSRGKYKDESEEFYHENLKEQTPNEYSWVREIGLSQNEFKKYKSGKDVYFTYERMLELLKNSK